ncbi:MAG: DEAD/DEAH box helicase [Candidatus Diapherotrites archaeon]|uniref:DEAD/DEAH box helicase n=1 Tax=Candidatus Iainarchaeum sp. TaxID=3101447 RepID=A0A7J4JWX0_9ARCH|nr:DEAD/DEAH box helicase [Candidatus Diapherotrites archaeon]HIH21490.1 DEAD/DEAH box helicase [Candidatus Diapherotrites archaeon]
MSTKLSENVLKALDSLGFKEFTEVQEKAIPYALSGEDLIVQSRTGTGKTAAFAIPILEKASMERHVQALILVPTRELAVQVFEDFRKLGKFTGLESVVAYGGVGIEQQARKIRNGAQIVVGTPGRILDLIGRNALSLSKIRFFVLDEADLMLAMGFIRDVERIMSFTPAKKQVLLYCVDFPQEIIRLAERFMRYPQHVKLISEDKSAQGVKQCFYQVMPKRKLGALIYLLKELNPSRAIIFCKTKRQVTDLEAQLNFNGIQASGIQGDMSQALRNRVMDDFKSKKTRILIATDVAARGIHVDKISHIINFELPHDINYYIHRIGRTGRMRDVGEAVSLCYSDEMGKLGQIERLMGKTLEEKFLPDFIPAPKFTKTFHQSRSQNRFHSQRPRQYHEFRNKDSRRPSFRKSYNERYAE